MEWVQLALLVMGLLVRVCQWVFAREQLRLEKAQEASAREEAARLREEAARERRARRQQSLRLREARKLLSAGRDTLADGEVATLTGTVVCGEPIVDPLTGHRCAMHVFRATTMHGEEITINEAAVFVLETKHGEVLVDSRPDVIALPLYAVIRPTMERLTKMLGTRDRARNAHSAQHAIVMPGDRVSIYGVVQREHVEDGERGYRDMRDRMRLVGQPRHPLTIGRPRA
jgi:hypothetical protein